MKIHNEVCEVLGIDRAELAKILGVAKSTIDNWNDGKITATAQKAMELLLELHQTKKAMGDFSHFLRFLNDRNINSITASADHKDLIGRLNFILNEYGFNTLETSQFLEEESFERLDLILNFKKYPSFSFLKFFAEKFNIDEKWLLTGQGSPFSRHFIKSEYYLSRLKNEIDDFNMIYLVYTKEKTRNLMIIVQNKNSMFDIFNGEICLMVKKFNFQNLSGVERENIYVLAQIYKNNRGKFKICAVDQTFYDGLFDKQIFPGKIKGKEYDIKFQLHDLLTMHENKDFDDPNSDEYRYYRDCFELIKNNCNV